MNNNKIDQYLTHVAYDSVIFGFSGDQLKILIMEYHNTGFFALPGGFVRHNEPLDDAVQRGLKERTGLADIYLEQFHAFGSTKRHQPEVMKAILKANNSDLKTFEWMLDRFISIAFYALIDYEKVTPRADHLSDSIGWYDIDQLPELMLDHQEIVSTALAALRSRLYTKPIGNNLLPLKFTMKQLQRLHEAILGEELRRTTFQRKMLSLDILQRHEKQYTGGAHKAPYLYSFKEN
ncbi:MAG: NUDIX hydrolase [Cyclobacteriaceae bacterium]